MLKIETRGTARWVILDRPEVRNALSGELARRAADAVAQAGREDAVRSIVIAGSGTAFSAGGDLAEMKSMRGASIEENVANALSISGIFYAIADSPKPVIARIHGPALAGALGIIASCDVAIAAAGLTFAFTETRLGLAPAMISPFIVRRMGPARAARLFMTAETFSTENAERWGLIDRVVPAAELDAAVEAEVKGFEKCAPRAVTEAKRIAPRVADGPLASHRQHTAEMLARMRTAEEGQEGMASFLEKRKPRWSRE